MRLAVLFTGEYRTFRECRRTMVFLDQTDPNMDMDVFFSTWNKTNTVNPVSDVQTRRNGKEQEFIYQTITEKQVKTDIRVPVTCAIREPLERPRYPHIINSWSLGFDMLRQSDIEYDYVLLARPDLFFDTRLEGKYLLTDQFENYKNGVGTISPSNNVPTASDNIFFSTYSNMEKIMTNLKSYFDLMRAQNSHHVQWHEMLYEYITKHHNLELLLLPFLLNAEDPQIARYPVTENTTFEVAIKQWRDWFEENN